MPWLKKHWETDMPGVLDFLFEGRPPTSVTTYGQTVENIPKWLSDYTQGLIGRANVIAAEPYVPYEGPRIAGFSPDQLAAFEMTRENVGSTEPLYGAGVGALGQAAQTFPGAVQEYMNPYIENVLDRQKELSMRTLSEEFIPELQSAFVGSGTFGGKRMEDLAIRGTRDIAEGLQGQQLGALGQAYGQAADIFGSDAARMLQAGLGFGDLAGELQRSRAGDVAALEAVGREEQGLGQQSLDLAYQDFLRQQQYPREMVDWMSSVVRGLPSPTATTTTDVGPAESYGPSGLGALGQLYSLYKGTAAKGGLARAYAEGGLVIEGEYEEVE